MFRNGLVNELDQRGETESSCGSDGDASSSSSMPELLDAADAFSSRRTREEQTTARHFQRRHRLQTRGDRRHIWDENDGCSSAGEEVTDTEFDKARIEEAGGPIKVSLPEDPYEEEIKVDGQIGLDGSVEWSESGEYYEDEESEMEEKQEVGEQQEREFVSMEEIRKIEEILSRPEQTQDDAENLE